ncbi:hypothetical protein JYU14_03145 [Simkania negevensis]|uniref:Uncharacterized protein n=1 Tax=Simkania negevensis TaxID=83561 RepID=A0ABS3ASC5_9BACT|nr:hypothetical protein [Simkania negevensis]
MERIVQEQANKLSNTVPDRLRAERLDCWPSSSGGRVDNIRALFADAIRDSLSHVQSVVADLRRPGFLFYKYDAKGSMQTRFTQIASENKRTTHKEVQKCSWNASEELIDTLKQSVRKGEQAKILFPGSDGPVWALDSCMCQCMSRAACRNDKISITLSEERCDELDCRVSTTSYLKRGCEVVEITSRVIVTIGYCARELLLRWTSFIGNRERFSQKHTLKNSVKTTTSTVIEVATNYLPAIVRPLSSEIDRHILLDRWKEVQKKS